MIMLTGIFSVALFLMNFNFIMIVTCSCMSNSFIIAIHGISSTNGASTMTNFCSFNLISIFPLGKNGIDLFRKVKQESRKSITLLIQICS